MAKLTLVCGFVIIFALHQSDAGPNNQKVHAELKKMFRALENVNSALKSDVDAFVTDLDTNGAKYSIDFNAINDSVTSMANKANDAFEKNSYYANDAEKKTAIKTAVENFLAIYNGEFDSCPGYNKINEILGKVNN